jgi:hypothetical protein
LMRKPVLPLADSSTSREPPGPLASKRARTPISAALRLAATSPQVVALPVKVKMKSSPLSAEIERRIPAVAPSTSVFASIGTAVRASMGGGVNGVAGGGAVVVGGVVFRRSASLASFWRSKTSPRNAMNASSVSSMGRSTLRRRLLAASNSRMRLRAFSEEVDTGSSKENAVDQ